MDVLAIIGFVLLMTSGADLNDNVSILGMIVQVIVALAMLLPKLFQVIREEEVNE